MSESSALMPMTAFSELADTVLLAVNQTAVAAELSESFIAGVANDESRRSLTHALERTRDDNAKMADVYKLVTALAPYEPVIRALVEQLHLQSERDRSVAA
jgi:hypothetical protein